MTGIFERLAAGDQSAADDCVREYGGLIWRLSRRYLNHAQADIEDAVQDVFIEIWLHAKRYDPSKGSEAAFIATIAHRRLIDRQRRIGRQRNTLNKYAQEIASGTRASIEVKPKEFDTDFGTQYRKELDAEFRALPDDERNALWLSVFHGLSHRDISQATSVPVGTVKSRLRRAMIRLTKSINSDAVQAASEGGKA